LKTLIVIPAYNEEETIAQVIHGAVKHADVCVVDDASKDKTPEIIKGLQRAYPNRLFTVRHEKNERIYQVECRTG
jgi:dolichol-phosphate mannosyltransferase